jgi:hypothetical protein
MGRHSNIKVDKVAIIKRRIHPPPSLKRDFIVLHISMFGSFPQGRQGAKRRFCATSSSVFAVCSALLQYSHFLQPEKSVLPLPRFVDQQQHYARHLRMDVEVWQIPFATGGKVALDHRTHSRLFERRGDRALRARIDLDEIEDGNAGEHQAPEDYQVPGNNSV